MPLMLFPEDPNNPNNEYQNQYLKEFYKRHPNGYVKNIPERVYMQEMQSNHFEKSNVSQHMREYSPMWKDGQLMTKQHQTTGYFKQKGPSSYQPMWRNAVNSPYNVFLAAAFTPMQIADQATAAAGWDGNSSWDKDYGRSDPLSLRPLVDLSLDGGIVNSSARRNFERTVTNPEYAVRNPMGAVIYGAASGNMDYPKAFANEYLPKGYQFNYSDSPSNRERVGLYKR